MGSQDGNPSTVKASGLNRSGSMSQIDQTQWFPKKKNNPALVTNPKDTQGVNAEPADNMLAERISQLESNMHTMGGDMSSVKKLLESMASQFSQLALGQSSGQNGQTRRVLQSYNENVKTSRSAGANDAHAL